MNFGEVITAMVTPMDKHGEIDYQQTKNLINHLIQNGSDGLVVAGTTGESPTLTHDEKLKLFQFTVDVVNGRVPVIAGTGSNNTRASVKLTKEAEKCGVDGIMLVTPYYNKPNQAGMYEHFSTIAQATTLPVMLYNIPGRSAAGMTVDTIVRLAQIENIVSVKEASGDLEAMTRIIYETPSSFSLYSGDDALTLPVLSIGGAGIVSVSAHILGNEMKQMVSSFRKGDVVAAAAIHQELVPMMKAMFMAPSPAPVKAALQMYGLDVGGVRLPMVPLTDEERQTLFKAIHPKLDNAVS